MGQLAAYHPEAVTLKTRIAELAPGLAAIPHFPRGDAEALKAIMQAVSRFVDSEQGLKWLIASAVDRMPEWGGIPALRAIWDTRHDRAATSDGCERIYFEREAAETDQRIAAWKREVLLAPPEETAALPVVKVKRIDAPRPTRTERDLHTQETRERLSTIDPTVRSTEPKAPIYIAPTRVRTPEERARLEADVLEQVRQRQLKKEAQA